VAALAIDPIAHRPVERGLVPRADPGLGVRVMLVA
jgi:hypothetical protein